MKVPASLDELLDLMRAKRAAEVEWQERGEGGSVLSFHVSLFDEDLTDSGLAERAWPPRVDATPQNVAAPDIAAKPIVPRVSDIELALNPPPLDHDAPDEEADIDETVASLEAPRDPHDVQRNQWAAETIAHNAHVDAALKSYESREKAPVGASVPDDAA
jgi:hypothetical protein